MRKMFCWKARTVTVAVQLGSRAHILASAAVALFLMLRETIMGLQGMHTRALAEHEKVLFFRFGIFKFPQNMKHLAAGRGRHV